MNKKLRFKFPFLFRIAYGIVFGNLFKRFDQFSQKKLMIADMKLFRMHMGYSFDLNNPKTFNEKIQWYAFNWNYDKIVEATDKVLFKDYIEKRLGKGYTIPLIGHWNNIDEFKKAWNDFPEKFVLKSNLSADEHNMRIVLDKSKEDLDDVVAEVKKWLKPENTQLNCVHCNFYRSTPQILAEEYRTNKEGKLVDYKFFCFGGEPYCLYIDIYNKITFYDLEWNKLDVQNGPYPTGTAEKPKHFDEMIAVSRKLSCEYPFVRVDFYDTEDQLYVGEMTFNPGGGMLKYTPQSFDEKLGTLFRVPLSTSI